MDDKLDNPGVLEDLHKKCKGRVNFCFLLNKSNSFTKTFIHEQRLVNKIVQVIKKSFFIKIY